MTRHEATSPSTHPSAMPSEVTLPAVHVSGDLTVERIFTPSEAELVNGLAAFAAEAQDGYGEELLQALTAGMQSLATLALALESYGSLKDRQVLGQKERSFRTLMRTLVDGGEHGLEWVIPTKAVLCRTFGIAKVQFLTSLRYVLEAIEGAAAHDLRRRLTEANEEAVYVRLAEELYASFITSRTMRREVKELAAEQLIEIWEGRTQMVTNRFCPLLRSAWAARLRAPRVFGTLRGTQEILQLLFSDCDESFVDFFVKHEGGSEPRQAFEEFLFDLAFEDLERVRRRMHEEGKTVVGPREVEMYLGFGEGRLRPLVGGTKALYTSFRRRRVKAKYRASMRAPGPKRTAEAYMLEALLMSEADRRDDEKGGRATESAD